MGIPAATIRVTIPGLAGFVRFKGRGRTAVGRADAEVHPLEGFRSIGRFSGSTPRCRNSGVEGRPDTSGKRENGGRVKGFG